MSIAAEKPPVHSKSKPQARVVVLDDLAAEGLEKLAAIPGIKYDIRTGLKGEELREALRNYEGGRLPKRCENNCGIAGR